MSPPLCPTERWRALKFLQLLIYQLSHRDYANRLNFDPSVAENVIPALQNIAMNNVQSTNVTTTSLIGFVMPSPNILQVNPSNGQTVLTEYKRFGYHYYFWAFLKCTSVSCSTTCKSMKIYAKSCIAGNCDSAASFAALKLDNADDWTGNRTCYDHFGVARSNQFYKYYLQIKIAFRIEKSNNLYMNMYVNRNAARCDWNCSDTNRSTSECKYCENFNCDDCNCNYSYVYCCTGSVRLRSLFWKSKKTKNIKCKYTTTKTLIKNSENTNNETKE